MPKKTMAELEAEIKIEKAKIRKRQNVAKAKKKVKNLKAELFLLKHKDSIEAADRAIKNVKSGAKAGVKGATALFKALERGYKALQNFEAESARREKKAARSKS